MTLKQYNSQTDFSSGLLISQLDSEIRDAEVVTDFTGVLKEGTTVKVFGGSLNDESALDAVIASHVANYTSIVIRNTVQQNKTFADEMMQSLKEKNISEGLSTIDQAAWVHHKLRKVDYTLSDETTVIQIDVMNLVISGDIETAESVLGQMTPDDMSEDHHWWTQERIDWVRNEIRAYLGWPLI